ncbi:MAG: hypothetical protein J7M14_03445 [Planctomycetes bacterium]|nr:hypothetical protein [Planctomycetota bacterium]
MVTRRLLKPVVPVMEVLEGRLLLSSTLDGALSGRLAAGRDAAPSPAIEVPGDVGFAPAASVELTSPTVSASTEQGETFDIAWSGGSDGVSLQLWSYGPGGWSVIATNVDSELNTYSWDTCEL